MQYSIALTSFVGLALSQGVLADAPAGCKPAWDGKFEITVAQVTKEKRSLPEKRAECGAQGTLVLELADGKLTDAQGRTGYIAANYQFQFDAPPQDGSIKSSGFSVCEDGLIALGSSKTFYECLSGDFYNLYDRTWAEQCSPVSIIAVPCGSDNGAGQQGDGQVIGTTVVQTTIVTALPDGQPQVITTSVPVTQYTTYPVVSEHSDGQPQVTDTPIAPPTSQAPPPPPASTPPAPWPPASSAPPTSYPVPSTPAATPSPSLPITSETPSGTPSAPAPTSPAPSSPASPSPTPTGGSSHVTAGSMGALAVGMVVAFLCL